MSTKSDQIDLNSDAVLFERENSVHGVNVLEPNPCDGVSVTKNLTDPLSGQDHVPEPGGDKVRDSQKSTGLAEFIGGSNLGVFEEDMKSEAVIGVETRMESGDRGIGVEAETGSIDKGIDVNGESLVGGEIEPNAERRGEGVLKRDEKEVVAVQVVEAASSKLEEATFEESKEETYVTVNPSSTSADALQAEIGSDLGSLPSVVEPYCLVANTDESVSCKDPVVCSHVSKDGNLDGLAMEINLEVENQITGLNISEARISLNAGNLCSEFKLLADLKPCVSRDANVSGDVSVKSAVSKPEFCASDLVWGKVRSHPWWPGQIFDPSASSEKAKKYFKKESYLIAYFGDHTFAWNEASQIKSFWAHFSQMEKQSSSEDFRYAIFCALEEVSRRVEFGLACPCISKEVYDKVKTQIIINAGIREEFGRKDGGGSFSSAASFEPVKLVGYMKTLASLPCYGGLNRLEFVTSQAQLLAFHRWKGYSQLPEFQMLGGLLENEAEISLLGEVKNCCEATENAIADLKVDEQGKGKSTSQDSSSRKRKNSSRDTIIPRKKEKSLSDLITERCLSNGKSGLRNKVGSKLTSSSFGKKRKADESISDDSLVKHRESHLSTGDASKSPQFKQAFRVGASILRVASLLNGSSPLLKHGGDSFQKFVVKNKRKEKSLSKILFPTECSSLNEMLSQLCLAARNPMKKYGFLMSIVIFFSEFRNSVSLDQPSSGEQDQSPEQVSSGKIAEKPTNEPQSIIQQNTNLDSEQQPAGGNPKLEAIQPVGYSDKSCNEDLCEGDVSPTALILNFTDFDSVPSEANLNKIFSHYGSVIESQTEVLKKSSRAKVFFRRRADAEVAFSRAGKYSTFGPSLVSYRLRYIPSTPNKASPNATKRSKKDVAFVDGNAT